MAKFKYYDGTNWVELLPTTGGTLTGALYFGDTQHRISQEDGTYLTRYNDGTISLPNSSGKGIAILTDEGNDYGLLYVGSDGAILANSGDTGYVLRVNDKDTGTDILQVCQTGGTSAFYSDLSVAGSISEGGTALLNKYQARYSGTITDFNDALTEGEYQFDNNAVNGAKTGWGKVLVKVSDGGTHNNTDNWIWQIALYTESGDMYERAKTNNGSWTTWKKIAYIGDNISAFNNDSGYITSSALSGYVQASSLGTAAYQNVSAFASANHTHFYLTTEGDNRYVATEPNDYSNAFIYKGLKINSYIDNPSSDGFSYVLGLRGWSDNSGGYSHELAFNNSGVFHRQEDGSNTWGSWSKLAYTSDIPTNNNQLTNGAGYITSASIPSSLPANGGNADTVDNEHASAFAHICVGNNLITAGNEFNFIADNYGGENGADVWINYTTPSRNNSAKITGYILGTGHGTQLGVVLHSGNIGSYLASQSSNGFMSSTDKTALDGIVASLNNDDSDSVVNRLKDVLSVFQDYPEGTTVLSALNSKLNLSGGTLTNTTYPQLTISNTSGGQCGIELSRGGNTGWGMYVSGGNFYLYERNTNQIAFQLNESDQFSRAYIYGNPLAYTSDIPSSLPANGGNADTVDSKHSIDFVNYLGDLQVLGGGTPASDVKTYWSNNIGTNRIDMAYNDAGAEYSVLFSKAPSGNYGSVLKWGYTDRYLRILRYSGGWASTDWEKIDAGYADSAGSVAWSNVSNRPTDLGDFTNNANYATQSWVQQQNYSTFTGYTSSNKLSTSYISGLATVATSGSYNDLSNKPSVATNGSLGLVYLGDIEQNNNQSYLSGTVAPQGHTHSQYITSSGSCASSTVSDNVSYLTTAPSSANTSGRLKFVVLSSEPSTKYDGYVYIITGS